MRKMRSYSRFDSTHSRRVAPYKHIGQSVYSGLPYSKEVFITRYMANLNVCVAGKYDVKQFTSVTLLYVMTDK